MLNQFDGSRQAEEWAAPAGWTGDCYTVHLLDCAAAALRDGAERASQADVAASPLQSVTDALIILRPGIQEVDLGSMLVLGSALLWGVTMIVIKMLARTESSMTITGYMNLLLTVFSLIPAILVWRTPSAEAWVWLVAIGVLGTLAQVALAQSLKETEASTVLPFDFLKLIWVAILGYILFAETVDAFVWAGAAVVLGSSIYLAYRESQVRGSEGVVTASQSNGRPT